MPRSAFLEGAREAGGTKTCTGAIAKQKTAVPQGAASPSLAVLVSDGRKREVAMDSQARWELECAVKTPGTQKSFGLFLAGDGKRRVGTEGNLSLGHPLRSL